MDSTAPRVLCVAGSPRRRGNSERLLEECILGIRDAGGEPDVLVAVEAGIAPCRGCHSCSSTGACVIRDAMQDVYPRIDVADAVVVASPVFFAGVPAVLKSVYDRCQPYWARRYALGEPPRDPRPGALLLVRGGGDPFGFRGAVDSTKSVFHVLGVSLAEELQVEGPDAVGDMDARPNELAEASDIGHRIVARARGELV